MLNASFISLAMNTFFALELRGTDPKIESKEHWLHPEMVLAQIQFEFPIL
jgi:hypothetical protein